MFIIYILIAYRVIDRYKQTHEGGPYSIPRNLAFINPTPPPLPLNPLLPTSDEWTENSISMPGLLIITLSRTFSQQSCHLTANPSRTVNEF